MKLTLALAAVLVASPSLFAQTTTAPQGTIRDQKIEQQQRISQGERNGSLSPTEANRIQRQEAGINREEQKMRARHGGHLTRANRKRLKKQQKRESRRIYKNRHDGNAN